MVWSILVDDNVESAHCFNAIPDAGATCGRSIGGVMRPTPNSEDIAPHCYANTASRAALKAIVWYGEKRKSGFSRWV